MDADDAAFWRARAERAEAALRASEQRWKVLAESIPDHVAILDREARLVTLNRSAPEDASPIGRSAYSFLDPESAEAYRRAFDEVLVTRQIARFESRVLDESGRVGLWLETILVPLADAGPSQKEQVLAVARDVTDRKRNEEAVRASEQRWRTLVESLPDTVLLLDRERYIVSANVPGMPEEGPRIVGRLADSFLDATMLEEFHGHFRKVLTTERCVRYEIRSAPSDGRASRWFDAILVPLKTNDAIDRIMVVTRDVTSRRQMLASLAEKERLASVGMVAASVAHEIMNPLAYVLANVELALGRRHEDVDGWRRALVDAKEGAQRMQQIVWDLRSLGRTGKEGLLYVDARSVLETALRLSGPEVGRTAKVELDLAEVPGVFANESQLCQVFINLLINAAQSMTDRPPNDRVIRVRSRYDDTRAEVAVEVSDRGGGIPVALQGRVFEAFFTTKEAGTGLGLSISSDIVARMGGRIELTRCSGEGSTFTVWLPTTGTPLPIRRE